MIHGADLEVDGSGCEDFKFRLASWTQEDKVTMISNGGYMVKALVLRGSTSTGAPFAGVVVRKSLTFWTEGWLATDRGSRPLQDAVGCAEVTVASREGRSD